MLKIVDEPSVVEAERLKFKDGGLRKCRPCSLNAIIELAPCGTDTKGSGEPPADRRRFSEVTCRQDESKETMTL